MQAGSQAEHADEKGELYDEIVDQYSAVKANPFKVYVEEPTFFSITGEFSGLRVLDLACGSGHFSRKMRQLGAAQVVGVDVSSEMIAEAKKLGDPTSSDGNLSYVTADATNTAAYHQEGTSFDLVTAQYLFPYAGTQLELNQMCSAAFASLKPGGRFVSVTSGFGGPRVPKVRSEALAYEMNWEGIGNGVELHDGICVQLTLLAAGVEGVTFPNHLWSRATIARTLVEAGFQQVHWCEEVISEGEGAHWVQGAREDFGLCHFLVAQKALDIG